MEDHFGAQLRALRRERGMTLGDVALAAGLTRTYLSRLERGSTGTRPSKIRKILTAIGAADREVEVLRHWGGRHNISIELRRGTPAAITRMLVELRDACRAGKLTPEISEHIRSVLQEGTLR